MGFLPKKGSILYSPAGALVAACRDANIAERFGQAMEDARRVRLSIVNTQLVGTSHPTLYDNMVFCVACGAKLEPFVVDIKECPDCHGRSFPTDDSKGLPIIAFEPEDHDG